MESAARPPRTSPARLCVGQAAIVGVLLVTGCGAQDEPDRPGGGKIDTASSGLQTDTPSGGLTATGAEHLTETYPTAIPPWRTWGKPIEGDEVATLAEAEAAIDFEPLAPTKLGPPAAIIVNPQELAFVYDHPTFGVFLIRERKVDRGVGVEGSQAAIVSQGTMTCTRPSSRETGGSDVPFDGEPYCSHQHSLEVLADGRNAVLSLTEQGGNGIGFVDEKRALRIDITGQTETFDSVTAVAVANLLLG